MLTRPSRCRTLPMLRGHAARLFGCALLLWSVLLCGAPAVAATPPPAPPVPIMENPAWERLKPHTPQFGYVWNRRYLELKSIAQDVDIYTQQLPPKLENLHTVTVAAQHSVVALLLDLLPARPNVQESSYILWMLKGWRWRLEEPLNAIAPTTATLDHFLVLLSGLQKAVEDIPAIMQEHPELESICKDIVQLYDMTHQRAQKLRDDIRAVRSTALLLFRQIEDATVETEKNFPLQWIAYYADPLIVTQSAFERLDTDFIDMCVTLTYDPGLPSGVSFAIILNILIILSLWICHGYMRRLAADAHKHHTGFFFFRTLCKIFYNLDVWRRLALAWCVLATINALMDNLSQFHVFIPFVFVTQTIMAAGLALWARTTPDAPRLWEMLLPFAVGIILLQGDSQALLVLLGMGGSLGIALLSLLLRKPKGPCLLRRVWIATLGLSLLLTILGLGRISVVFLLLVIAVAGSAAMLTLVNNSDALRTHMLARAIFVPVFSLIIFATVITLMTACPGVEFLIGYWNDNPLPLLGIKVDFTDACMILFFLLGLFFVSNIARQFLEGLARRRRILDSSAVPVMHAVINCALWGVFAIFLMRCMGVDISSLAFIGGGLTVGVGIAAKTVLGNFFCGLVIIFSRMVRAGDMVEINSVSGRVLSVNMRATVVETTSSGILLVPNEEVLSSRMTNWTLNHRHVCEDIHVRVACSNNVDNVLAALVDAAAIHPGVLTDPPPKAFLEGFGEHSTNVILRVWVSDVNDKLAILSDVRLTMGRIFAERGITLASTRLDITMTPQTSVDALLLPKKS